MDALTIGIVSSIIAVIILALFGAAWARDRVPIKARSERRLALVPVAVDGRPDHELPPSFIFPARPNTDPPDPEVDTERYIAWALANGGVHANKLFHRFSIRGVEKSPVSLDRVAVRVLERRLPLVGLLLDTAAGGDSIERWILADLDQVNGDGYARIEQTVDEWDPAAGDYVTRPWDLLDVSQTDSETFILVATTQRYDCDFVVEIHYRGQYRSGVLCIDQGGKPFRVSALRRSS